jgi:hypothetical protein
VSPSRYLVCFKASQSAAKYTLTEERWQHFLYALGFAAIKVVIE